MGRELTKLEIAQINRDDAEMRYKYAKAELEECEAKLAALLNPPKSPTPKEKDPPTLKEKEKGGIVAKAFVPPENFWPIEKNGRVREVVVVKKL